MVCSGTLQYLARLRRGAGETFRPVVYRASRRLQLNLSGEGQVWSRPGRCSQRHRMYREGLAEQPQEPVQEASDLVVHWFVAQRVAGIINL